MSEFVLRDRPLAFDERCAVEDMLSDVVDDPEGAAWTIVALQSLLRRNGLSVEVLRGSTEGRDKNG